MRGEEEVRGEEEGRKEVKRGGERGEGESQESVTLSKMGISKGFQKKRLIWLACYGMVLVVSWRTDCMGEGVGAVQPLS